MCGEDFEEFLYSLNMAFLQEVEPEISHVLESISVTMVTMASRNLYSGKGA